MRAEFEPTARDLADALEHGEIVVHLQPQVQLSSQMTRGFEALMRWRHPQWGLIQPDRILPVAISSGQAVALGETVLRLACRHIVDIQRRWPDTEPAPRLSVNLSPVEIADPSLATVVALTLADSGLDPDLLWVELTETAFMHDLEATTRNVGLLRALGVHLAIDDFGTGWSSLSHLRHLPVEALKIDRSFVAGLGTATDDTKIVSAVVALAHSLGMTTVAEGIETEQQRTDLIALGCDLGQGYLWSCAIPADELVQVPGERRPERRRSRALPVEPTSTRLRTAATGHTVEFYESEDYLATTVCEFVVPALQSDGAAFLLATAAHVELFDAALMAAGVNVSQARRQGRLLAVDPEASIDDLLVSGQLNLTWFDQHVAAPVARLAADGRTVRVYSEAVAVLWQRGQIRCAIELERGSNDLASRHAFELLCGYPTSVFAGSQDLVDFETMCTEHSDVVAVERYTTIAEPEGRRRSMARIHVQLALMERERAETLGRLSSLTGEVQRLETLAHDLSLHDEHLTRDVRGATHAIAQYLELLRDHHAEVPEEVTVAMIERARGAVESLPEFIDRLLKLTVSRQL